MAGQRFSVNYPWIFNLLTGTVPRTRLDDNFNAVNDASAITINAMVLTGDYALLVEEDSYSFLICKAGVDIQITLPGSPSNRYSFFFSNESTNVVTLVGTVFINGASVTNPTFAADYTPYFNVKGGLVFWNGSRWDFYPLYQSSFAGDKTGSAAVADGDSTVTITHGYNQAGIIVTAIPYWQTGMYISAETNTTTTFIFTNPGPPGGSTLKWRATPS